MKIFSLRTIISATTLALLPLISFAQYTDTPGTPYGGTFREIVTTIVQFIGVRIMPILVALALLAFFFNLIIFIIKMDSPTERQQFKKYSVNALVGLFIMLTVWGIVGIATRTLHWGLVIPQLPTSDR